MTVSLVWTDPSWQEGLAMQVYYESSLKVWPAYINSWLAQKTHKNTIEPR